MCIELWSVIPLFPAIYTRGNITCLIIKTNQPNISGTNNIGFDTGYSGAK